MTETLLALALLRAIPTASIGGARIVSRLLDRRDYTASQQSREAQVIALAKAEIAATKRGDLLAAARLAEQQEGNHVPLRSLPVAPSYCLPFAIIPNPATLVLVAFAFLHCVMEVLSNWLEKLPDHNDWTQLPDGSFVLYDEAHSDGNTHGL